MTTETKNNDSFDTKETASLATDSTKVESSDLAEVLQRLREVEANTELLKKENERLRSGSDNDDVEQDRKHAGNLTIATYEGKPIIDMKLEKNLKVNHLGETYTKDYKAICTLHGQEKPIEITYGELGLPTDYLNLPRVVYQLVDQNESDLSGASKIEYKQVTSRGEKVPEIDRSSGQPIKTGKMVELITRNDIRWYTIMVGDEKVTLRQDKIYR